VLPRIKRGADQRYKEFKAVAFYDHEMAHRLVSVTRGTARRRPADASGCGADRLRVGGLPVGNIDGGPWIIGQIVAGVFR